MEYAQLGSTGTLVSRICLGTANFGGADSSTYEVLGGLGSEAATRLVDVALDAGVNFVDTADSYGFGQSEEMLGTILKGRRDDLVLASKVHNRMGPGTNEVGQSRIHVLNSLEDTLRRLQTDHVDLYHLHSFDPLTSFEEVLRTLDDVVRQGKVRYVGCSNLAAWQVMKALGVSALRDLEPIVSVQAYYSLVGRDLERELLPLILDQGLGLTIWSPLAGGLLTGKFTRNGATEDDARRTRLDFPPVDAERSLDVIDVLVKVASNREANPAQVALSWLLAKQGVTSVIVGARKLDQLNDNLEAVDLVLTESEIAELDEVGLSPPTYPGWLQAYTNSERWPAQ